MRNQEIKTSETLKEITSKLEDKVMESSAWRERVVEQLQSTRNEVNKFFEEDIKRDVPTGTII